MLPPDAAPLSPQAWLTEIHEYAQKDVVIMLLGNKVRVGPPFPSPRGCPRPGSASEEGWGWGGPCPPGGSRLEVTPEGWGGRGAASLAARGGQHEAEVPGTG